MKFNKRVFGAVIAGALLLGSLSIGVVVMAQQEAESDDQVQEPAYSGSIAVDQAQYEGMSEADEATALQGMATLSADEAKAAAEAANPGTTAIQVELDNENGVLVYSVELGNGLDVKVDAGNSQILHTEQAGADQEAGDLDDVQDEYESQADDAFEAPHAGEDAVGH
jgi:uncharacterized membrane protein YkoI